MAAIVAFTAMAGASRAQTSPASPVASPLREYDRYALTVTYPGTQLRDHIYERSRRYYAAGEAQRDALKTPDAVRRRQAEIRRVFVENLGGLPASNSPLNPRVVGSVDGDGFRIEKIIFESRPKHYVTANLYLPAQRAGKTAAVLFLSGHHATAKQVPEYQNVCQTLVRAGLIVFSVDPVGQGERWSYYDPVAQRALVAAGTREHSHAGVQSRPLGEAFARYMLHDAMRAIDYLVTRPEVDAAKIGVTGNSGGGTQTSLVMLADPRIAAAAPATFIMSRDAYQRTGQGQDAEQIWPGFTSAGFDHEDILLAVAPKPVCVLAVKSDFFPIEGTRRTVARSQRIWELFGRRTPKVELVEDDSIHMYTQPLAKAAARFFAKHLLGRDVDLSGFEPKAFPPERLHCTPSGQVRVDFADAEFVFDETVKQLAALETARRNVAPDERRRRAVDWLRAQVYRDREDTPVNPRKFLRARTAGDYLVDVAFWYPQPYLANVGMLIRPRAAATAPRPVTIAIWENGTATLSQHAEWIAAECGKGRAVLVVNLCGVGPLKPDPITSSSVQDISATWRKLVDDLDWMGDSLVALRTYETLRVLDVLGEWPELTNKDVRLYAEGRIGVHAKLAAAIDPRIAGVEWKDGFRFGDHLRSRLYDPAEVKAYVLPGVLKYFEVDEL